MIKRRDKNQVSEAVPYITAQSWALGSQIADKKQKTPNQTKKQDKNKQPKIHIISIKALGNPPY